MSHCIETKKGSVRIESELTLEKIKELIFASDFTGDTPYKSIYSGKRILDICEKKCGAVAFAILDNKTIIGYSVFDYPDAEDRWAKLDGNTMVEIKAVEVMRELRNYGIARHLLLHLLADPGLERKIVYLAGYSWTWDFEFLGLSVQSYRTMLITLYTGVGLKEQLTNESNICIRSENFFMVRVGKSVPEHIQEDFKWLRFGLVKDDFST